MAQDDVVVRFGADAAGVQEGADQAAKAVQGLSDVAEQVSKQIQAQNEAIVASYAKIAEAAKGVGSGGLPGLASGANAATGALTRTARASTGLQRELLVLAHEAVTGRWTRLGGSLLVVAERMDAMALIFNPITAGLAAVTGGIVALAVAAEKGAQEARAIQGALEATNNYAGLTASAFQEMAQRVSGATGTTMGKARADLTQVANTGKFTGEAMGLLATDAEKMAQLTGTSTDKMLSYFEEMSGGVADWAQKHADAYHQITAAQFQHIQEMEHEGDTAGAILETLKDVGAYLGNQQPLELGAAEKAWKSFGETIGAVWEKMKGFGRAPTGDETLASLQSQLAVAQRAGAGSGLPGKGGGPNAQVIADLKAQIDYQQHYNQLIAAAAANHQRDVDVQTKGVDAAKALKDQFEASKTSGEKLKDTLAGINQELQRAVAADPGNKALYEREAAAARQQAVKSDTPKGAKNDDVAEWRSQLQEKLADSQNWFADEASITAQFWQNILSTEKLTAAQQRQVQSDLNAARKTLARQAFDDQIAGDREAITAAQGNWEAQLTGWAKTLSDIGAKQGIQSKQYQQTLKDELTAVQEHMRQVDAALTQGYQTKAKTDENTAQTQGTVGGLKLQSQEGAVRNAAQLGQINPQQELTQLTAIKAQEFALESQTAQKVLDAKLTALRAEMAEQSKTPQQIAEIQAQITQAQTESDNAQLVAAQRFENEKVALARQSAMEQAETYRQNVSSIVSTMDNGFLGMARGTTTFQATMIRVAESIENIWVSKFSSMVTDFVTGQTKQTAVAVSGQATQTAAVTAGVTARNAAQQSGAAQSLLLNFQATEKTVLNNAVAAASAAYQAMAGIPVIGPGLGAAAAALAFTAVEAYGNLASAAGGYDIPAGVNPLTQLHENEMVLPASIASPLRRSIANGSMSGDGGGGGGGTTNINHNWSVSALDARSVKGLLRSSRGQAMVNSFTRGK
jgi:phage-related minor tail protein